MGAPPLPFVPNFAVLGRYLGDVARSQRLDLWNVLPARLTSGAPQFDYIFVVSESADDHPFLVVNRPDREPDIDCVPHRLGVGVGLAGLDPVVRLLTTAASITPSMESRLIEELDRVDDSTSWSSRRVIVAEDGDAGVSLLGREAPLPDGRAIWVGRHKSVAVGILAAAEVVRHFVLAPIRNIQPATQGLQDPNRW